MTKEFRTYVEDVDRTLYDISDATDPSLRLDAGLTPDIVREISAKKDEPSWMLDFRLKALDTYQRLEAPGSFLRERYFDGKYVNERSG